VKEAQSLPQAIHNAIIAVWISIAGSALLALLERWLGVLAAGEFAFELMAYGVMCIIPYKIQNRSNAARYWYAVLSAIGYLFFLGGGAPTTSSISTIGTILMFPLTLLTVYWLFAAESSAWFHGEGVDTNFARNEPSFNPTDWDKPT